MKEYVAFVFILITLIFLLICFKSRNQIRLEQERDDCDNWISAGEIPCDYDSVYYVDVRSIVDLIKFSIDINTKVTFDKKENIHFLTFNGCMYVHKLGM